MTAPDLRLTPLEAQVLLRIGTGPDGESSADAARDLGMTAHEVGELLRRIRRSLGVDSTAAAVALLGAGRS